MKFDVISCTETERGLIVELDVDEEGRQYLIDRGFSALLADVVKEMEEDHERETPEGI
jgi:DNA-dependent RNA polymerase auxiliary subunit epsilon